MEYYIRELNLNYINSVIDHVIGSGTSPYPIYLSNNISNFLSDPELFKGIFVLETQRYYSGELLRKISNHVRKVGFFMTYELGRIDYSRRPTLNFNVVYNFDYNSEIDHYGALILKFVDWFVSKHQEMISSIDIEGCNFISLFEYLSQPIYRTEGGNNVFIRRSLVFNIKTMVCGG